MCLFRQIPPPNPYRGLKGFCSGLVEFYGVFGAQSVHEVARVGVWLEGFQGFGVWS